MKSPVDPRVLAAGEAAIVLGVDVASGGEIGTAIALLVETATAGAERVRAARACRAFASLTNEWAILHHYDTLESANRLQTLLAHENDDVNAQILAAFKSMLDARCDEAWPYIARMTVKYLSRKEKPDEFFRRTGHLLERCGSEDIRQLELAFSASKRVLAAAGKMQHGVAFLRWTMMPTGSAAVPQVAHIEAREFREWIVHVPSRNEQKLATAQLALDDACALLIDARLAIRPGNGVGELVEFPPNSPHLANLIDLFAK